MVEQLTILDATKLGYTHVGDLSKINDYQHIVHFEDFTEEHFKDNRYILADPNPTFLSVDGDYLWDLVQDSIMSNSDTADDTDIIPDALKAEINWDKLAEKINVVLKKQPYYRFTKIELIA